MLPSITGKYLDTMYDEETIAVPLDSRIKPIVTPSFLLYEKQWIITLEGEVRTKERGQQVFSHPKGDLTTNRRGVGMPAISITTGDCVYTEGGVETYKRVSSKDWSFVIGKVFHVTAIMAGTICAVV